MRYWSLVASFWRALFRGRRLDTELDDELNGYLSEMVARKVAAGLDPAEARRHALLDIGSLERVKEDVRDVRIGRIADETARDISYALRMLRKAPAFTAAAVATLALGVGAITAIFSVVHALLIEPLPYADAARLVMVWADQSAEGYPRAPLSGPELIDLETRATRFEGFAAIWATTAALTGDNEPEQLRVGQVTPDFFALLGANAALGRTFVDRDVVDGPSAAILLSDAIWQRRYGANPAIVGSRILVNGQPATVIGVMPRSFRLLMAPDASIPDDLDAWLLFPGRRIPTAPRGQRFLRVLGRVRPDVTIAEARADIEHVGAEISQEFAFYGGAGRQFDMISLHSESVRDIQAPLLTAFTGVAILLLIACVNVASLLIARAAARTKETAVRVALGAGSTRILRQHLIEGLVLTVIGSAAGVVVGRLGLDALLGLAPPALSRLSAARVNIPVVAFSTGIMLLWGVLLSLAPLTELLRVKLAAALRLDAARAGSSPGHRLRTWLITAQLALSVVLVVAALLLVRTVINIQRADLGFDASGIQSFRLAVRPAGPQAAVAFARRLQSELAALPGVIAAGSLSHAPYDHVPNWGGPYLAEAGADASTAPQADYRTLSPGALELLQIRLLDGRSFSEADDIASAPVVIVDQRLAARTWPGASAVGKRLLLDPFVAGTPSVAATVVGVVAHVRHRSPVEEVREQVYFPQRQVARNPSVYVVKTAGDPSALMPFVREAITRLDPVLPIYDVRALDVYVNDARATRAFIMRLAVIFAVMALILAAVGVYGVIAYSVALRHREFGVRRALGAEGRVIVELVARDGAALVAKGLVAGLGIAAVATWWMRSLLYGLSPWDMVTFASAIPALLFVGAGACVAPALRAMKISPIESLRVE